MSTAPLTAQRVSKWRAFSVVFSLVATLLVAATSVAPQAALADTGEAAYGTPTQALQAAISLGDTPEGRWRDLNEQELLNIQKALDLK